MSTGLGFSDSTASLRLRADGQDRDETALSTETSAYGLSTAADSAALSPSPSIQRNFIQGKTLAMWQIERRRSAEELLQLCQGLSSKAQDRSYPVRFDRLLTKIDDSITTFRGIPGEEAFSVVLQGIRDYLRSNYGDRDVSGQLLTAVRSILYAAKHKASLGFEFCAEAEGTLIDASP